VIRRPSTTPLYLSTSTDSPSISRGASDPEENAGASGMVPTLSASNLAKNELVYRYYRQTERYDGRARIAERTVVNHIGELVVAF
jgi:hypothetical protein